MVVRNLKGTRTIVVNPERIQFPLYGDAPHWRVGSPGTILGNVASGVQIVEASKKRLGTPDPTWVKVTFREVGGEYYLLVSPWPAPADPAKREPDTYPLKYNSRAKAPIIRGLKALFEATKMQLRADMWYEMESEPAEDEGGAAVCANWTKATTSPRTESSDEAAAGQQETETK